MDAGRTRYRAGQLDGIRALCVAAVIFSHTIDDAYTIGRYQFYEFGNYGVCMFFVLSGYLITGQLIAMQRRRAKWGEGIGRPLRLFYARRMLRLFPAYYLAVLGAALIDIPGMRAELPWHLAQMSDILFALDPVIEDTSAGGHLWSLTVEWQFYLVWPVLMLVTPQRWWWLLAALLGLTGLYSWVFDGTLNPVLFRTNILQSLDSVAFGAGLAILQARGWGLKWLERAAIPAAAVWGLHIFAGMTEHGRTADWLRVPGHEAMNLLFAAIVYRAATGFAGPAGRVLEAGRMRYIGRISYGIYVYHMFILTLWMVAAKRMGGDLPWGLGVTIALFLASVAVAAASWRWIEAPVNRWRDRFAYAPPAIASAPVSPAAA